MKTYTIILEEDLETGDLVLPLSNAMLAEIGWTIGDVLEWIDNKDGSWMLRKKINNEN